MNLVAMFAKLELCALGGDDELLSGKQQLCWCVRPEVVQSNLLNAISNLIRIEVVLIDDHGECRPKR
jgi:hypothetical protein